MEWVETTGRSIDEAKELALDQLGVADQDAEFEIVEEPRLGLFGRTRGEARVRARVRPTRPRPKVERRDRRRGRADPSSTAPSTADDVTAFGGPAAPISTTDDAAPEASRRTSRVPRASPGARGSGGGRTGSASGRANRSAARRDGKAPARGSEMHSTDANSPDRDRGAQDTEMSRAEGRVDRDGADRDGADRDGADRDGADRDGADRDGADRDGADRDGDATVEEQAVLVRGFLEGLLEAFDLDADVIDARLDEDTIEIRVQGDDLGLLIGPKGQTLQAVQDLSRTFVQRRATGTHHGRVRIDVGAYRQRRREALERFSRDVARDVLASGASKALEPMSPADRKVVHDTINGIDGVRTASEGLEPRRWVVILPAPGDAIPSRDDLDHRATAVDGD